MSRSNNGASHQSSSRIMDILKKTEEREEKEKENRGKRRERERKRKRGKRK
jgi:hypothetical protein